MENPKTMKRRKRDHSPEHRTELLTLNLGTVDQTPIHLTYRIDVTIRASHEGVGGYVSARPTEIQLGNGEKISLE